MRCNIKQPSSLGSSETPREATFFHPQQTQLTPPFILSKKRIFTNIRMTTTQAYQSKEQNSGYKETDFNFSTFLEKYQPHTNINKTQNTTFLEWFVGFSEGDGSFFMTRKRNYFVINQKDLTLLYKIQAYLGFGVVFEYMQNGEKIGRYAVQSPKNCLKIATIFNGNLVLEKTNARFTKWLKGLKLSRIELKSQVDFTTSWFAGFTDAEGCFYGRVRKQKRMKTGFQFLRKFCLGQKSEYEILHKINVLVKSNGKIHIDKKAKGVSSIPSTPDYKLEISSAESNHLLLNYFRVHPCLGKKRFALGIYMNLDKCVQRQDHLNLQGLKKIQRLCKLLKKYNSPKKIFVDERSL